MARTFTLARSCVIPDEAFESLPDAAARLVALCDGVPVIVRHAAVARGPGQMSGECLAVCRLDRPLSTAASAFAAGPAQGRHYETVGYVFARPTQKGDAAAIEAACGAARSAFLGRAAA